VIFALTTLTLLVLFTSSYRQTRSRYSLGWTVALLLLLIGAAAYLLIDTPNQVWALPIGNALTVVGLVCAWSAVRSLRLNDLPRWVFIAPAAVVAAVSFLDHPATNVEAGQAALFAATGAVMALASREVLKLGPTYSRTRWSLLAAAATLSAYYFFRLVAYVADGFGNPVITAAATETTATVVTEIVLIVVSFSMTALSHEEVTQRLRARATRSSRELSEGARVQQNLLPEHAPDVAAYPLAGVCVPSRALSGDFFDWERDGDRLIITVGDVMGKGVGAAVLGASVRAGLRLARGADPKETVTTMLSAIGRDLVRNDSFVTLFHAHLDTLTGQLTVLDAGHGLAVLVRADGSTEQISSVNLPLGLNIDQNWRVQTLNIEVGDRLLVFSDGVLDLFDGSLASLGRAVDVALTSSTETTVDDAVKRIEALAEGSAREDDVTVVALERLPVAAALRTAIPNAPLPAADR
jgi:sigma-B regulation protein RsbU (phosphoserine phosphatase)